MVAVPDREVEQGGVGGELRVSEGQWHTAGEGGHLYLVTQLGLAHALHHGHKLSSATGKLHLHHIQICKQCLTHQTKKTTSSNNLWTKGPVKFTISFSLVISNSQRKLL